MWEGFKNFILRGNVIDLAVAVVIGAAFTQIVDALVNGLINPLLTLGLPPQLKSIENAWLIGPFKFGLIVSAIISFIAKAAVVYFFIVRPFQSFAARFTPPPAPAATPEDVLLLREIRDALKGQSR